MPTPADTQKGWHVEAYLIVKADGSMRIGKGKGNARVLSLGYDEIAFKVNVLIPATWGQIRGEINLELPDPTDAQVAAHVWKRLESEPEDA